MADCPDPDFGEALLSGCLSRRGDGHTSREEAGQTARSARCHARMRSAPLLRKSRGQRRATTAASRFPKPHVDRRRMRRVM